MSFLQPLFLAGLLAASLPIIIHLINRRKAVRRSFPALRLLRESNERIARSVKVRQWLLLALRVLVIAVLAVALAKPFVFSSLGDTADDRLPTAVVFVVENGVAMDYDDWFERAGDELRDEIGQLRPWDEAALVTTADDDPVEGELTTDHRRVVAAADQLQLRHHSGDLTSTLLDADEILAGTELPNRRVVVIGSGTDAPLETVREMRLSSPIDYIDVSDDEPVHNLAITDVDYHQRGAAGQGEWNVDVAVANFGPDDRHDVLIELKADGNTVSAATADVPAGESVSRTLDHQVEDLRIVEAVVEIEDSQGLESDNRWHFALQPDERIRTLLVNGSPSSVPYDDELFFLNRALEPLEASSSGFRISETTPDGLDDRQLGYFDVVVLANVSRLSSEQADQLEQFVRQGGGLFISMGDEVDVDAYNHQLEQLLPRPLRGEKQLAERDDPDAPIKTTRLGHPRHQHPVFESFNASGSATLQAVSVYSYMLLDPAPSDRDTELLLSYQNDAPALLERTVDSGRVLLFTSTIDRDWTDFPVRAAYLPLMNQSLNHLARTAGTHPEAEYVVGERADFEVRELVDDRAIIHAPQGERHEVDAVEGLMSFTPRQPGIHRVYPDEEREQRHAESLTFAANTDRSASAFESFPESLLEQWGSDEAEVLLDEQTTAPDRRRINLWSYLLFVVTIVLLAETVLGARRSVLVRTLEKLAFWRQTPDESPELSS